MMSHCERVLARARPDGLSVTSVENLVHCSDKVFIALEYVTLHPCICLIIGSW